MAHSIVQPTASQQAAAEALLADPRRWSPGRSKQTGQTFWLVRGSRGRSYFCTPTGCSCPGYRHRGVCSHVVAAVMKEARQASRQSPCELPIATVIRAPRRTRYEDLFPADA
jgi:hypothetical protein